jgi:ribosomal protein L2
LHYGGWRKANISLLGLNVGDVFVSARTRTQTNAIPLRNPVGTMVQNIEMEARQGRPACPDAGNAAQLLAKEVNYATSAYLQPEVRMVPSTQRPPSARSQVVSELVNYGKDGRKRQMAGGRRSRFRQNPCDHPSAAA